MFSISLSESGSSAALFYASREARERKWFKDVNPCSLLLTPNVIIELAMLSALCALRFCNGSIAEPQRGSTAQLQHFFTQGVKRESVSG